MKSKRRGRRAERVVRHTLADGTVKEYRYAPHKEKPKALLASDSIAALITAYQRSPEWRALAAVTQQNYTIYLRPLMKGAHASVGEVRRRDLLRVHDAIAAERGNGAATGFIRAASAIFSWAVQREWIEHSPATKIKTLKGGHLRAWTRQEAEAAIALLPEPLRRVVVLALYTGQRRGDLCAMPWSAYDGSTIRLTQQKTGESLVIPCHPELRAELDRWQASADPTVLTILTDAHGQPWKPNLLSHYLPAALVRIGLTNELNVHGLRKLAATNLAEAGCSTHEIAAVTGHRTLAMVALYTRSVDQEKLAGAAIVRLSEHRRLTNRDKRTNKPAKSGG